MICSIERTNIYLELLDHLTAAEVCYAVLHDWESLCQGEISDIDMVVAIKDLGKLKTTFREHYWILNVFHYEASSFGFVLSPKNGDFSCIFVADVSTDYRWGGRIFFSDQELLQNRWLWNGYWVAGPLQEFAYLLAKKIYEKGNFPQGQRTRIRELARNLESQAQLVLTRLLGHRWGVWVLGRIASDQWSLVEAHVPALRRRMALQPLRCDIFNPVHYWAAEIRRCWDRWRHPTGVSIALIGPEGPWKRKLMLDLQARFLKAFRRFVFFDQSCGRGIKHLLRERALLARSTLVVYEIARDDFRRHTHKQIRDRLDLTSLLSFAPDLSLISEPGSSGTQQTGLSICGGAMRRKCNICVIDNRLTDHQMTQRACELVGVFLATRYSQRRHIWFAN